MSTSSQIKPPPSSKYEIFVEEQLAKARGRIRALDMTAAGLGFVIGTLVYALLICLVDRWLDLPTWFRQLGFAVYGVGAVAYLAMTVVRPLCWRVNPYYAARQMEQTSPGSKNSVVSWLDLRTQNLPPAIRGAVSHKAAKDLARADLDQAISTRRAGWLGGVTLGLFFAVLILFFIGPRQFRSLLARAFAPFSESAIATRTSITIKHPVGGNTTVAVGKAVSFTVQVDGNVPDPKKPDALKLLFRYHEQDEAIERLLEPGDEGEWVTIVPAYEVQNGFWYKVTGGDAETPEYRVEVRSTPHLTGFEVKYHYRPYLNWRDSTSTDPNLEAVRGTEVTVLAHTNRAVKSGRLEMVGDHKNHHSAELVSSDPQAMRFHFVMDHDGEYHIFYVSDEGERNTDLKAYAIKVLKDLPPRVTLTKPEREIKLPANGVLKVEGIASDDFGLTAMTLKMRLEGKGELPSKPYREGKKTLFQLADGGYPQKLDYKDFVELDKVKDAKGQPVELRPGMVLEYFVDATDNCDYPAPQVGRSDPAFKVTIVEPEKDQKKQQQERAEAKKDKERHDAHQDKDLAKESQERKEAAEKQQQQEQQDQQNNPDEKPNPDQDKKLEQKAQDLQKALEEQKDKEKGDGKPEGKPEPKGEGKPDAQAKPQDGKGEAKQPDPKQQGGQAKGEGKNGQNAKGENDPKGEGKGLNPQDAKANQDKNQPGPNQEAGKDQGNPKKDNKGQNDPKAQGQGDPKKNDRDDADPKAKQDKNNPGQKDPKGNDPGAADPKKPDAENKDPMGGKKNEANNQGDQGQGKDKAEGKSDKKPGANAAGPEGKAENKPQPGQKADEGQGKGKPEQGAPNQQQPQGKDKGPGQKDTTANGQDPKGEEKKPPKDADASGQAKKDGKNGDNPEQAKKDKENQDNNDGQGGGQAPLGEAKGDSPKGQAKDAQPQPGKEGKGGDQPKGEAKDAGKLPKGLQPPKGEDKPATDKDKPEDSTVVKGEGKGDNQKPGQPGAGNGGKPEKATQEEIDKLAEAMGGDDPKTREEAAKKLDELMNNAKDPAARKAAAEALEKAAQGENPQPGAGQGKDDKGNEAKKPAKDQGKPSQAGKESGKGEKGNPDKKESDSKDKPGEPMKADGKGKQAEGRGQKDEATKDKPGKPDQGDKPGEGKGKSPDQKDERAGTNPNATGAPAGERQGDLSGDGDPDNLPPTLPKNYKKAGSMQLEDLKKQITPEVLKKANMTEAEYQEFLKAYQEMLKRKTPQPKDDDKLPDPRRGRGNLSNQAARRVEPGAKGKADKLQQSGAAFAPPEFRERYYEFTQKLSEQQSKDQK